MDITDVFAHSSIEKMSEFIDESMDAYKGTNRSADETAVKDTVDTEIKHHEEERKGLVPGGDLSAMLQLLAEGKIDTKEAGKYI